MSLHDRILLATDLGARSDRALDRAVRLATREGAKLIVLHVLEPSAGNPFYPRQRPIPELAACVGYEQASDSGVKRRWFVPEDDTDCDQVTAGECDEFTYLASGKAHIADASCVTAQFSVPGTNTGKSCLVGGPACIDGAGATDGCSPVGPSYCLPDAICARAGCAQDLGACLRDDLGGESGDR